MGFDPKNIANVCFEHIRKKSVKLHGDGIDLERLLDLRSKPREARSRDRSHTKPEHLEVNK
ncbi:hypothetical protein EDO6_00378 [Paenibacillus xylanexedens]|nr:hypothetical protein EDO6_00378 [Paenibacillus xylanexedens]